MEKLLSVIISDQTAAICMTANAWWFLFEHPHDARIPLHCTMDIAILTHGGLASLLPCSMHINRSLPTYLL